MYILSRTREGTALCIVFMRYYLQNVACLGLYEFEANGHRAETETDDGENRTDNVPLSLCPLWVSIMLVDKFDTHRHTTTLTHEQRQTDPHTHTKSYNQRETTGRQHQQGMCYRVVQKAVLFSRMRSNECPLSFCILKDEDGIKLQNVLS